VENDAADGNPQRTRFPTAAWKSLRLSRIPKGKILTKSTIRNLEFLTEPPYCAGGGAGTFTANTNLAVIL
jgi:hypothetical protein